MHEVEPLLRTSEVAETFRVGPDTVRRWADAGKLSVVFTLGGHRRYLEREIRAIIVPIREGAPDGLRPGTERAEEWQQGQP
ncbi:hypothetical protein Ait01nite_030260 [Actinoplanes italicus]|uniref:Excisionase family DNA binding protein n=1 Tax=Actinoplanes italicus TaxID=113567 RepID=A0A2T0KIY1_9ACTN|nr:helix-turn-helix domain-containing protein [Actinoplanes italicus]PRX23483.1 excisionase family DNA binding protein [Actinoplanes italicus]GIE29981.1 hypothetical protein Ait01nite_030260 [Actinoplanes italicus]